MRRRGLHTRTKRKRKEEGRRKDEDGESVWARRLQRDLAMGLAAAGQRVDSMHDETAWPVRLWSRVGPWVSSNGGIK